MSTATKTPAKKTATKTSAFKPLPFSVSHNETETVVMPNGQTVKKKEVMILKGMLQLELNGRPSGTGETASSIAQRLLGTKKKLPTLMDELVSFIIANRIIEMKK